MVMLFDVALSLIAIFVLLVATEILWRSGKLHVETSRKIVHIGTGAIIAFWPYFLDWTAIQLLSLAMLAAIFVSYRYHILKSIHSIKRLTIGEILYPAGIGLCALLEPAPWVFMLAILHLTLADGLAAIIGIKYGKHTSYNVMSHGKSLAGSFTFFLTSFLIFTIGSLLIPDNALPMMIFGFLGAAAILTFVENVSWYGLDDITVPISAIVILTMLTS
jgi:phytol kinase